MKYLIENDIKPSDIITRKSLENAMTLITVLGGSTNAVLHLLAIAHTANIPFTLDDFQQISNKTPYLADLKPSGKHLMEDLHKVGGTAAVLKYLIENGLIDGSCLTITETLSENLKDFPDLKEDQHIVNDLNNPIKKSGHIRILKGNLAEEGAVAKITGKEGLFFRGKARVFNSEVEANKGIKNEDVEKGDVIVIRYEGPKGGQECPKC